MTENTYTLWIKTGDQNLAGTDSNVFIQLTGTSGKTDSILLPPQDIFSFESGQTDKYVLEAPDLGELEQCCIGHDNEEGDSGWYVVDVKVRHDVTGREWTFEFNRWLGLEESGELSACVES